MHMIPASDCACTPPSGTERGYLISVACELRVRVEGVDPNLTYFGVGWGVLQGGGDMGLASKACHACGQVGHLKRDCPTLVRGPGREYRDGRRDWKSSRRGPAFMLCTDEVSIHTVLNSSSMHNASEFGMEGQQRIISGRKSYQGQLLKKKPQREMRHRFRIRV